MTRAEKIRQMDDNQLADFLCSLTEGSCKECYFANKENRELPEPCGAMDYLKGEANEPVQSGR